jgi:glycosyltransferase involved in cell wall biosynthesis
VRILLAIHNAYTDSTSGAAQSMRILMQWLAQSGHECRVLATARFDAKPPDDLDAHLETLGVPLQRHAPAKAFLRSVKKPANVLVGRPTVDFRLQGVPVSMLLTRAALASPAERFEVAQYLLLLDDLLQQFKPGLLLTYGGHPVVAEAMRRAKKLGAQCVFALHNRGYEDRRYFNNVDRVYACSRHLSDWYRTTIGLVSAVIEPPIEWDEVEAPTEMRRFVTFVNPAIHKGVMVFARLADMLGSARPDIPVMVVQSATSAGRLNAIPELDFGQYPHIVVAPPTSHPRDFFALTKILLVPSTFPEPFGRVAAEALINGIPPLVSDRGALPQTVHGAGRVLPLPAWMTESTKTLPSVEEVQPWFNAVCELWDVLGAYEEASKVARRTAEEWYGEAAMRQRYLDYFTVERGAPLFDPR